MLPAIAREAARRFGDAPALAAADGWSVSYRDLDRRSDAVASALARRGIGAGDLVSLVLPSTPDYVVAYLAAAKVGAVTTGVNPNLTALERARIVDRAGPDLVLATDALSERLATDSPVALVRIGDSPDRLLGGFDGDVGDDPPAEPPADRDRPVAVVWTSGSTGDPKGAVFTERQLGVIAERDLPGGWGSGGPSLAGTQFAHVGFMTKLPWYLMAGGTLHLMHKWRAAEALRLVAEHRMTTVGGVAPQVALMLRVPEFDALDLTCVQYLIMGGGPSSPALVEEARRRFDAAYSIRYSSTESGGIGTATAFDADDEEALFTVGRPRPGVALEIHDDDGPIAQGEVGEVVLQSPTAMREYWRDPKATARAWAGGWLHTGDLGAIDERGCLRLAGRAKEMYVRGGYNVFPMEVEAVLASHPLVRDVAVVPRPDPVMGDVGVAVVVPRVPGQLPSLEDLRAHSSDRLAGYKLPEAMRIVDELPLTAMNKVDRAALAAVERPEVAS